ncbi:hypothetical protein NE237_012205 [Protea cynaroides]|uniref:Uncharacterized protein n=1 Tax=Protea cynaroides TaxID=273540 RepID=A0A9Q0H0M0_9MAGN|nr:hypothetical protein NE237_012205 [Protea cynaroides]
MLLRLVLVQKNLMDVRFNLLYILTVLLAAIGSWLHFCVYEKCDHRLERGLKCLRTSDASSLHSLVVSVLLNTHEWSSLQLKKASNKLGHLAKIDSMYDPTLSQRFNLFRASLVSHGVLGTSFCHS